MIVSRVEKQPKLNKVDVRVTAPAVDTMTPRIPASQDEIRERAFQMYQERGSKDGHDLRDWLRAEHQILKH
jgi:hypothetical protein